MRRSNHFSGNPLDRRPDLRAGSGSILRRVDPAAIRIVPVHGNRILVAETSTTRPIYLEGAWVAELIDGTAPSSFLGERDGLFYWALDVEEDESRAMRRAAEAGGRFTGLKRVGAILDPVDAAILAQASAATHHHRHARFCGICGSPTVPGELGTLRRCSNDGCRWITFPRTDPAIIVLLEQDGRCLLARDASWPERQYATIAGFVEPGESLEDAVAREVREETGLEVVDAGYHSSQPWPFPSSIMIGFTAIARGELALDPAEIEDARWFTRDELQSAVMRGDVRLPSEVSISRRLVEDWLESSPG